MISPVVCSSLALDQPEKLIHKTYSSPACGRAAPEPGNSLQSEEEDEKEVEKSPTLLLHTRLLAQTYSWPGWDHTPPLI